MKDLIYKNNKHEEFYFLNKTENDVYRNALIYLVGLTEDTRNHFSEILTNEGINLNVLHSGWITGETRRLLILGFNLYNGYMYESEGSKNDIDLNTVSEIFSGELAYYYLQAIDIRFDVYKNERKRIELYKNFGLED
ncbi:DUF6075 family protein [Marinilactibacillus psychrotolerans]|uniref:DUF6075 family protein n=1 Tax=Marinilactibacillus psychrotolerans TaxID=191770 RepID=A0ABW8URJ2_9LACT